MGATFKSGRTLSGYAKYLDSIWVFKDAGVAHLARASAFQAEGSGFEPRLPLQEYWLLLIYYIDAITRQKGSSNASPPSLILRVKEEICGT